MVEGVRRVVVCRGKGEAFCGLLAISDGVVLVAAVAGGDAAVCGDDLAEGVVTPGPAWDCWEGSAAGGDSGALADDIHGLVILRNHGAANFVLVGVELGPAIWDDG